MRVVRDGVRIEVIFGFLEVGNVVDVLLADIGL